jgi:hypothetical protein
MILEKTNRRRSKIGRYFPATQDTSQKSKHPTNKL